MGKRQGFTIIEVLIVLVIVGLLALIIFTVNGGVGTIEPPDCSYYANANYRDIPARCIKYFEGGSP